MRQHRSLKRKVSTRSAKKKFVLYLEGKNTEPCYFSALKKHLSGALIDFEIIGNAGDPKKIAESASLRSRRKAKRSSFEQDDEIWAVFDRDEHQRIKEAFSICERFNIYVAFSDPCFELWLILHYEDFDKLDSRHKVQNKLSSLCDDYNVKKGKKINCALLMSSLTDAETRAERQLERRMQENSTPLAPHTTVFKLTRSIRAANERYRDETST